MALTDTDWKTLVIDQVGDDAATTLAGKIDLLWAAAGEYSTAPKVRFEYAKRGAIQTMQARVREQVDFETNAGLKVSLEQKFTALATMLEQVEAAIAKAARQAGSRRAPAVGQIETTAPIGRPVCGGPDANSRRLRGDAYARPTDEDGHAA